MATRVAAIGTASEVEHHVAPLRAVMPIECLNPETAAAELEPGDLAIFFSEHFERFRRCCTTLKERGVATLYLVDGILEWRNAWENRADEPACPWTMRPVLSDKVACIGNSQARVLAAWGNGLKVEVTGIPRMDSIRIESGYQKDPQEFRVLVCTAKFPGFTPRQSEITLQSLLDLKKHFDSNGMVSGRTVQVTWRLAPQIAGAIDVPNSLGDLNGCEIAQQIRNVDAVITTPSTVMLEAMLLQRPVALLDFHNSPHYVPAVWSISAASQIESVLEELASPALAKMAMQQQLLADALQVAGPATQRVGQLVTSMLETSARCIQEGRPVEFPAAMLPPASSQECEFDHQLLFPDHGDFKKTGLATLQAELAHCRREIRHLESVIAGLRDELGQAHEIFDQIQRHPVAGPVVRLRQRVIDWSQRRKANRKNEPASGAVPQAGGDQCNQQ